MSKRWWVLGGLSALALGCLGWANRRLFTVHDITTGESDAYPELRSRVYYVAPDAVLLAAEQAIKGLPPWKVLKTDPNNLMVDAEVNTPMGQTDDVTLYVQPLDGGQTRAVIRSRARRGGGDGGRNAGHIRVLQDAMDGRLTRDAAF